MATIRDLFLGLLMYGMLSVPLAVLLYFNFALDKFPVLARPVVDTSALGAGKSDKLIL